MREWSEGLNVPEQVEGQRLEENQRWYVRCDGCRTNSLDGWKEVKVGCVYRDYPQCGSDAVPSARETSIRYVASRPDAAHSGLKNRWHFTQWYLPRRYRYSRNCVYWRWRGVDLELSR